VTVNRQWHIVLPKAEQSIAFLLPVLVNTQVDFGGQPVNVFGCPAGGVIGFGVTQVIYQAHKIPCGFIGVGGDALLYFLPTGFVLFYKKAFSQVV
jgi:surfactin synthase thioesterase subunit